MRRCAMRLCRLATTLVMAAVAVGCACGGQLKRRAPDDLYRALTRGGAAEKGSAALDVLRHRHHHARAVVRRAIAQVAAKPFCPQLRPLTDTLEDACLDDTTRAGAALALGRIARDSPCTFPARSCPAEHNPIPAWAQDALRECAEQKHHHSRHWTRGCRGDHGLREPPKDPRERDTPAAVARACAEALGYVSTTSVARLEAIRDDASRDTALRIFAGRAVSRLTRTRAVTSDSLDQLVLDAQAVAKE